MKKTFYHITTLVVAAAMVLAFAGQGFALEPDVNERGTLKYATKRAENVRKRIETLKMWKLTKTLDLDEVTAAKLFPMLNRFDREKAKLQREVREALKDLRTALRDGDEDSLTGLMQGLDEKRVALSNIAEQERKGVAKVLSVKQQASYVLFQLEFNREIRNIIADVKKKRKSRKTGLMLQKQK